MSSFAKTKELENKQLKLKLLLSDLIKSKETTLDQINEVNSEIKHLEEEITKVLGTKEKERRKKLKEQSTANINIKKFEGLKEKRNKVNSFRRSVSKFLNSLEKTNTQYKVKAKV